MTEGAWHKSSFCGGHAGCTEVRELANGGSRICDRKDYGEGPVLTYTRARGAGVPSHVPPNPFA